MQIAAILIIAATAVLLVKRYQPHATLFLAGFALLTLAYLAGRVTGVPAESASPTGLFAFDLFAMASEAFSSRVARIGMIIMAAGGFAAYMSAIGASGALVRVSTGPLSRIANPYALLAITYVAGQFLNVFIPSAAGLAMLLLVAMFPTLVRLGVRPAAAAAVIGTPIAIGIAQRLGMPLEPFVLAVLFGANLSFATPMAYQTNILIMNSGGYKFSDFVRAGVPLLLIIWLILGAVLIWAYGL